MPHLTIQVTPNVTIAHEASFLKALNQALWDSGHFAKPADIKARIVPIETFLVGIADDEQVNGFVYAHLKIMSGRDEIIRHQTLMRKAAEVKVENGTMTVSDLMKEINAEEAAKQAKTLHETQYLMSVYALKHTTNQ